MARSMHWTGTQLHVLSDTPSNLTHVGERLQCRIVWCYPTDLKEKLLNPRLQESHNLGGHFPDLFILQRGKMGQRV